MRLDPREHFDADERHDAGQHDAPAISGTDEPLELDDLPIGEAVFNFDVECSPADPDVGDFRGAHVVRGWIVSWSLGGLRLTREHLCEAITEAEVLALEERTAERLSEEYDCGERVA